MGVRDDPGTFAVARLKGLRVLVIHPVDAEARVVLDQLQRIGCIVEQCWPVPAHSPEHTDVVLLAVDSASA